MRARPHAHPCKHCKTPVECCGDVEQNYDGFPEWICRDYHNLTFGSVEDLLCETCDELDKQQQEHDLREQRAEEAIWK